MTVEQELKRIETELHAQKAYFRPSLGSLAFPESAPRKSYSGSIDTQSQDLIIAQFIARFTRSGSQTKAPLVDFGFTASVSPNYAQFVQSQGGSISGSDLTAYEDTFINGYVSGVGENYVEFTIEVKNAVAPWGSSPKTINVEVAAYSMVEGTLTLQRTI